MKILNNINYGILSLVYVSVFLLMVIAFAKMLIVKYPIINSSIYWTVVIAISAFIFQRYYHIRKEKYNYLCKLELELLHARDTLMVNLDRIQNCKNMNMPTFTVNTPLYIFIDIVQEIGRIDLKNEAFYLLCDFKRINDISGFLCKEIEANINAITRNQELRNALMEALNKLYERISKIIPVVDKCLTLTKVYLKLDEPLIFRSNIELSKNNFKKLYVIKENEVKKMFKDGN